METKLRTIIHDGKQTTEALDVLEGEIGNRESLHAIAERAGKILEYAVDPIGGSTEPSYGLLYGLIQSGKTSVITVTAAMAADNGFKCIIILTSDINLLYSQTLQRIRSQLRGLKVLGKSDWDDPIRFEREIRMCPFVIVCSKNSSHLKNLIDAFKKVGSNGARGLPTLIIDDEADQASLNTKTQQNAKKQTEEISAINKYISEFRSFFQINTYLQVTATPQALFLQRPDGLYRPSFTVLSEPGRGYVGGEAFFEVESKLLREVDIDEVDELKSGYQPTPTNKIPAGLRKSILSFLVSATARNLVYRNENFSFLCHISHTKIDHKHLVDIIDAFREEMVNAFNGKESSAFLKLREDLLLAYKDIAETEVSLPEFEKILERIELLLPGASIKEINSNSDEAITPDHVYSIFVGGNKLGRGVTIPNLITSYYGRNPKYPNSDTVLQHARMYGYREKHIGVTRLFLPKKLAEHFQIIHQMEKALRTLLTSNPEGKFVGIYLESPVKATRSNVTDPNSIGIFVGGSSYNPPYPLRGNEVEETTKWFDEKLSDFHDEKDYYETTIDLLVELLKDYKHDPRYEVELWNTNIICTTLEKIRTVRESNKAYIRVRRNRGGESVRRETQGFLDSGEAGQVPLDAPTLFIYKMEKSKKGEAPAWWPQVRLPEGNYAIAFSFED